MLQVTVGNVCVRMWKMDSTVVFLYCGIFLALIKMLFHGNSKNLARFCVFPCRKIALPNVKNFCYRKVVEFSTTFRELRMYSIAYKRWDLWIKWMMGILSSQRDDPIGRKSFKKIIVFFYYHNLWGCYLILDKT